MASINFGGYNCIKSEIPQQHASYPTVTGTSIIGMAFDKGVLIAADTLGSYGSMAKFTDLTRIFKVNDYTIVAASGDYADFQFIMRTLEDIISSYLIESKDHIIPPRSVHNYLTRLMYQRRTNFQPLWNTLIVAGYYKGESFLGYVDKLGISYENTTIGTVYGPHLALPLLRNISDKNTLVDESTARNTLENALRLLYYRDCRSINRFQFAIVTSDRIEIEQPLSLSTNWQVAEYVCGYE